jgi:hypothetical protein
VLRVCELCKHMVEACACSCLVVKIKGLCKTEVIHAFYFGISGAFLFIIQGTVESK